MRRALVCRCFVAWLLVVVAGALGPAPSTAAPSEQRADPGARPGAYAGKTQGSYDLTFSVKRSASWLTGFDTSVVAYCIGASGPQGPTVWRAAMPRIRLSGTGRFDRTFTAGVDGRRTTIRVRGDLDGGRLTQGRIDYLSVVDGNTCETDGSQPLTAKRG